MNFLTSKKVHLPVIWALLASAAFTQTRAAPEGMKERTGMRNQRYCEVLIVNRRLMSAKAKVYNTIGLNECPADQWAALDPKKLAEEKDATMVILNGPRYFMMDRNALRAPGSVDTFGGIQMRALAVVEIKSLSKRVPYTENIVDRDTRYVYERGKYVYELLSPDARTYVLQSYSLEVDKNLTEAGLLNLASELKLPKGWQYRARKLDQDFVMKTVDSRAHVLQDDLKNSYQLLQ